MNCFLDAFLCTLSSSGRSIGHSCKVNRLRLRSGHVTLNAHLKRIGAIADSVHVHALKKPWHTTYLYADSWMTFGLNISHRTQTLQTHFTPTQNNLETHTNTVTHSKVCQPGLHIVKYANSVFEVRRTGSLCPSFSGNWMYVVICHFFQHRFTSLSLNRLSYSFVTC